MDSIRNTLRFHAFLGTLLLISFSVEMVSPSVIIDFESNGLQKCSNGYKEWVRVDNDYLVSKGVKPFEDSTGYIVPQQGEISFVCGVTEKVTLAGMVNVKIRLWASYKGAAAVYVVVKVNTVPVYFTQLTNGEWSTVNKETESVPEGQYQVEIQGLAGNEILIVDEIELSSDVDITTSPVDTTTETSSPPLETSTSSEASPTSESSTASEITASPETSSSSETSTPSETITASETSTVSDKSTSLEANATMEASTTPESIASHDTDTAKTTKVTVPTGVSNSAESSSSTKPPSSTATTSSDFEGGSSTIPPTTPRMLSGFSRTSHVWVIILASSTGTILLLSVLFCLIQKCCVRSSLIGKTKEENDDGDLVTETTASYLSLSLPKARLNTLNDGSKWLVSWLKGAPPPYNYHWNSASREWVCHCHGDRNCVHQGSLENGLRSRNLPHVHSPKWDSTVGVSSTWEYHP